MKKKLTQISLLVALTISAFTISTANAQWVSQTSTTIHELDQVYFKDANNGFALGVEGPTTIVFSWLKTTNGGATWTNATGIINGPFCMSFTSSTVGYAGGVDAIYKTIDGGSTWTPVAIAHPGSSAAVFSVYFYNASVGYACLFDYVNNITYMVHTTDAGATWTAVAGGVTASIGSANMVCSDANTCYAIGFNGGHGLYKTTDGGATWNLINALTGDDCHGISFLSPGVLIAAASGGGVKTSADDGATWTTVYNNTYTSQIRSLQVINSNTVVAAGGGGVVITLDGGATWSQMAGPSSMGTSNLRSVYFPNNTTGYTVGDSGVVYKYSGLLAVNENNADVTAEVYPNPTNGIVNVICSKEISSIEVMNVLGQKVFETSVNTTSATLNLSNQVKGIYFYRMKSKDKILKTGKLIIE